MKVLHEQPLETDNGDTVLYQLAQRDNQIIITSDEHLYHVADSLGEMLDALKSDTRDMTYKQYFADWLAKHLGKQS